MIPFARNDKPTIGIEEEFHLIDPQTAELKPARADLTALLDPEMQESVCCELFECVIENRVGVFDTVDDLVASSLDGRRKLAHAAEQLNLRLAAGACHPFGQWRDLKIADDEHYRSVIDAYGYIARRLMSFGLHIHVGVRSAEEAVYVMLRMRPWVYALMAMSTNSPFFEGLATGLHSTRMHLFGSMPRTHLPPRFETWEELHAHYQALLAAGDVTRPGELWWNIRPQPPLGTVELRVLDLPTDVHRLGALTAVYQAAVATFRDDFQAARPADAPDDDYLDQHRWRAMRDGLEAVLINPFTGKTIGARDYLASLFDTIEPASEQLGSQKYFQLARRLLDTPNESAWQLKRAEELNGDLPALELEIADRTLRDNLTDL
ncbi:MAG: YbdK family carboxylate-amine ligase [Phycisphaerales bacterium]|jgi:glutamate---cysteine ligase / carboxylate-amine ligase|nr:YbdK family carboxylate-amine ligase [Phycisphaerales bacterium]